MSNLFFTLLSYVLPPHGIEAKFPGAVETIIDLGQCWDESLLTAKREEVIALTVEKQRFCEQSSRYIAAAWSLFSDMGRIAVDTANLDKIEKLAVRLASELIKPASAPAEKVRLLSAYTANGRVNLDETAIVLADKIYLIEDEYGSIAPLFLAALKRCALARGREVISCWHPLSPYDRLEHLFIPSLSLGFMSAAKREELHIEPYRVISAHRFLKSEEISNRRRRISFQRKAANQMLSQSQSLLREALAVHKTLEEIYSPAMDWGKVDAITAALIREIIRL